MRLVAGLSILKHMHNLSDEALRDRWVENRYFQYFCGEVVFQHAAPFDRSLLTCWRRGLGEEQPPAPEPSSQPSAPLSCARPDHSLADATQELTELSIQDPHPALAFRDRE
jgi:hypothetical protein